MHSGEIWALLKAGSRTRKAKICCRAITNGVMSVGGREKKHIVLLPLDVPLSSLMRISSDLQYWIKLWWKTPETQCLKWVFLLVWKNKLFERSCQNKGYFAVLICDGEGTGSKRVKFGICDLDFQWGGRWSLWTTVWGACSGEMRNQHQLTTNKPRSTHINYP